MRARGCHLEEFKTTRLVCDCAETLRADERANNWLPRQIYGDAFQRDRTVTSGEKN
jgi:hypothetical protein